MMLKWRLTFFLIFVSVIGRAMSIYIPMDGEQKNHLKSYGIAFFALQKGLEVDWLLNYRGGSFLIKYSLAIETECKIRGISYKNITDGEVNSILTAISVADVNMDMVKLEKAPKIAVYSPRKNSSTEESDAVITVLDYAEIPYELVYDEEVLKGDMPKYDWLHVHHEDFTGQFSRNRGGGRGNSLEEMHMQEDMARRLGYKKVSQMKLGVAKKIRDFVSGGGFMFEMCSGADTFEIALAAEGVDIADAFYDGDSMDPNANSKLNFGNTFAFQNFIVETNPGISEFSDIDAQGPRDGANNFFTLFSFSAKWDVVPTMLVQNHDNVIRGFNGLTTSFRKSLIKPNVLVMGENKAEGQARYIHGEFGNGQWTFYGGHDPERNGGGGGGFGGGGFGFGGGGGRQTDLDLYPNSPGYRLILNNVLFPAAKKKKQKT